MNMRFYKEENISLIMGKISYNGGLYLMTMIPCDMTIPKEADKMLLTKLF